MVNTIYCTPQKVAEYVNFSQAGQTNFGTTTKPTLQSVEMYIRMAEAEVNRFTLDSWKEERISDYEYLESHYLCYIDTGVRFKLSHENILQLDSTKGDVLQVWNGNTYDDWLATKTEDRNSDFWLDYVVGELFLRTDRFVKPLKVRMKYRWNSGAKTMLSDAVTSSSTTFTVSSTARFPYSGTVRVENEFVYYEGFTSTTLTNCERGVDNTTAAAHSTLTNVYYIPADIQYATLLLTAASILEFEDRNLIIPETGEGSIITNQPKHEILRSKARKILSRYVRPIAIKNRFDVHV